MSVPLVVQQALREPPRLIPSGGFRVSCCTRNRIGCVSLKKVIRGFPVDDVAVANSVCGKFALPDQVVNVRDTDTPNSGQFWNGREFFGG